MADGGGDSEDVIRRNHFSDGPTRGFVSSLAADERIFEADLTVDRAHVVVFTSQDIIEPEVASEILAALNEIEATDHDTLSDGEDVHEAIKAAVIDVVGPDGGKMHTARSRNDEVATCIRHHLREDILSTLDAALALRELLLKTAAAHTETMTPDYTRLQPTQPTTVAHFPLSYEWTAARDYAHLVCACERINQPPLGPAAFAGAPFNVNRELTADLLGFNRVIGNSMDTSTTYDFFTEALSALTAHAVTLSNLAADLMIFSNKGLVELSDNYSSISSIMPQKENPDTMELVHAIAGDAVGELADLLTTLRGLPRAYNRGLQRARRHAFRTVSDANETATVAIGAVALATWPEGELAAATDDGFSTATSVADLLVMAGLPFHTAHEVVAETAVHSEETPDVAILDAVATDVLGESLFTHVTTEAAKAALDPAENVASRDSVGGPTPATMEATLSAACDEFSDGAAAVADTRDSLAAVTEGPNEEVSSYV